MSTITLNDGTKFEGLTLSGNTFEAGYPLEASMFPAGKLHGVTVTTEHEPEEEGGEKWAEVQEYPHMKLITAGAYRGKYRVILAEMTAQDLKDIETEGKLEYIAMMTGVEL